MSVAKGRRPTLNSTLQGTSHLSAGLFKSTAVISGMTFISRIFGYIRDVVFAFVVGASAGPAADAFVVAFKIPNFLRRLFAEGGFAVAFVPVVSEYRANRSQDEVRELASSVMGALGSVLLLVASVGMMAAPLVIGVFAPGFLDDREKYDLAVELLRITFPYLLFISLAAFGGGILNSYGRFAAPAFTPVLLNLAIIAGAVWLAPYFDSPAYGLAWGVFAGGILQMLFQWPFLWRLGLLVKPRVNFAHEGVKRILRLMAPAIFGTSVSQINLLLDTLLASFLATGSVTWLYLSDRLMEFPLGVFGVALGTAILPTLSRNFARGDMRHFSSHLDWGVRLCLLIGMPAATGLAVLAGPALMTLFQYGEFSTADVRMASLSLAAYAIGLLGFMMVKVLVPGYFARQDTRTPVRIAVIAMIANMVMNLMLIFTMAHVGLALATSLGSFVHAGLLYRGLRRDGIYRPTAGWSGYALRILVATTVMALCLWALSPELSSWFGLDVWQRGLRLLGLVAAGTGVYFVALLLLGLRPWRMLHIPDT